MYFPFFGGLNGDGFYDESDYDCNGVSDDYPRYGRSGKSTNIQCRRCGHDGLTWENINFRWRLVYSSGKLKGKIHACESEGD